MNVLSYIISILIMTLVYYTGGTAKVYANLMYIPIAIISSTRGKKQGIAHAIFSGLILGPFMPLDSSLNIGQEPTNWITRLIIYVVIATIIGYYSDFSKQNKEYITKLLTYDKVTNLKNLSSLTDNNDEYCDITLIALSVNNYDNIFSVFGNKFSNEFTLEFSKKIQSVLSEFNSIELYKCEGMKFIIKEPYNSELTERIIEKLNSINKSILVVKNIPIYIELRIGIAFLSKDESIVEGARHALIALNYSLINETNLKKYDTLIENNYKSKINIASNFINALKNNNIKVAYQNIYNSIDEKVHGAEILVRWINEDSSQISPKDFLPVIENTQLICDLTKHIIDKAIEIVLNNIDCQIVSINFSAKEFNKENIDYLINKIKLYKIDPSMLQIEITEDILVNEKDIKIYLEELKSYGISIAIDDFGTGYSSYQYLDELPIDVIKIDRSLILRIENKRARSIIKSIVSFCKENNIKTIAEGIETKGIANICKQVGIDLMQGYYYHKPEIYKQVNDNK